MVRRKIEVVEVSSSSPSPASTSKKTKLKHSFEKLMAEAGDSSAVLCEEAFWKPEPIVVASANAEPALADQVYAYCKTLANL